MTDKNQSSYRFTGFDWGPDQKQRFLIIDQYTKDARIAYMAEVEAIYWFGHDLGLTPERVQELFNAEIALAYQEMRPGHFISPQDIVNRVIEKLRIEARGEKQRGVA